MSMNDISKYFTGRILIKVHVQGKKTNKYLVTNIPFRRNCLKEQFKYSIVRNSACIPRMNIYVINNCMEELLYKGITFLE